jgi:enoyl-CoA hydratase/carnithine racemase
MNERVVAGQTGAVWRIELNRPDSGNLVTPEMVDALTDAVRRLPPDAKLLVLSGRGSDFCRGRDPHDAPESGRGGRAPSALELRRAFADPVVGFYTALMDAPVPTLAVVKGAAHGFGCALTGACDMALAGESSRFRLPEMTKGLPPTLAMAALNRIGARSIAYLTYTTAEVDAQRALAMGLVNAVYPDGELEARVTHFADTVSSQPLDAVRAVKEYLKSAPRMDPHARADFAASVIAGVLSSR